MSHRSVVPARRTTGTTNDPTHHDNTPQGEHAPPFILLAKRLASFVSTARPSTPFLWPKERTNKKTNKKTNAFGAPLEHPNTSAYLLMGLPEIPGLPLNLVIRTTILRTPDAPKSGLSDLHNIHYTP
jgi:hypothetical protein